VDKTYRIKCARCGEPTGVRSTSSTTVARCERCEKVAETLATKQADPDDFPASRKW
jgi:hypothetical protein